MNDFSYQLYSSRNFGPLEETLKMLADAGYKAVEGYGGLYEDAAKIRASLDKNGLSMPSGHFGLDMIESDPNQTISVAETLGIKAVFCPFLGADERPTDADGWRAFGARLQRVGQPIREAGLTFGWHNHDFEFVTLGDGSRPIDQILAGGPNLSWEADIAWIVRGGADPLAEIARYGDRIAAAHVKDIAPAGEATDEDGWADVGHGTMDWPAIMAALKKHTDAQIFVMEHDNPSDHDRFARRSIEAAREL